jgi:hypothetical protein
MRYSIIFFLPLLVSAIPLAQQKQPNNPLADGINANLDAGNQEITAVQNLQSIESNHGTTEQINAGIKGVQDALDTAVGDRTSNQAIAAKAAGTKRQTAVQAGLDKVEAAQGKAQSAIDTLNGGASDAETLSNLKNTFEKGFATNSNNLGLVRFIFTFVPG